MGSSFKSLRIQPQPVEDVPLAFGEWLPDIMNLNNPGAIEALNVIPTENGYAPFKSLTPVAGLALPGPCKGAIIVPTRFGDLKMYAATAGTLNLRVGSTWLNLWTSAVTIPDYYLWQFVQFGHFMVAMHPQVPIQSTDTDGNAPFANLGGNPPRAACGARVGDFLVIGNLDGEPLPDNSRQPQRIRWNGFNRIDAPWTTDALTQADFQDMPTEGGAVIGITGREFGTIFQEHSISRMSYVGLPTVFSLETVEESRGALCTGGIVDVGAFIYFIGEDGFYVWNGVNSTSIANNKINRYFFANLNYAERGRITGALDYYNQCVRWAFPTGNGTALTEQLIYSYKENRWSHAIVTTQFLLSSYVLPVSLDDLLLNLDTQYPVSFDDPSFQGGQTLFAGFDAANTYGTFSGAAMAATLETSEATAPNGARLYVNNADPVVDVTAPVCTMQIAARDQIIGAAVTFGPAVAQEITGECPVLGDGRYMRFRVNIPAGATWQHAHGVDVWRKATGRR